MVEGWMTNRLDQWSQKARITGKTSHSSLLDPLLDAIALHKLLLIGGRRDQTLYLFISADGSHRLYLQTQLPKKRVTAKQISKEDILVELANRTTCQKSPHHGDN